MVRNSKWPWCIRMQSWRCLPVACAPGGSHSGGQYWWETGVLQLIEELDHHQDEETIFDSTIIEGTIVEATTPTIIMLVNKKHRGEE